MMMPIVALIIQQYDKNKAICMSCDASSYGLDTVLAFDKLMMMPTVALIIQQYDENKAICMSCDASPYGLDSPRLQNNCGKKVPVAYLSRTLGESGRNYL